MQPADGSVLCFSFLYRNYLKDRKLWLSSTKKKYSNNHPNFEIGIILFGKSWSAANTTRACFCGMLSNQARMETNTIDEILFKYRWAFSLSEKFRNAAERIRDQEYNFLGQSTHNCSGLKSLYLAQKLTHMALQLPHAPDPSVILFIWVHSGCTN